MAVINGTPSGDTLLGTTGNDVMTGLAGDDELTGDLGKDKIDGGAGNDTLDGGADNDTLIGGDHNDILFGGAGNDAMSGGKGDDIFYVDSVADKATEVANQGHDAVVSAAVSFTLGANIEDLALGGGALDGTGNALGNAITGNENGNQLDGGGGNDQLSGDDAADILIGGAGDDTLDGGSGSDNMKGGAGKDVYLVDDKLDMVTELAGGGIDLVKATVDGLILGANVEDLTLLGVGNLSGTGNDLSNYLTGNDGNNLLIGGKGNDTINGGLGDDTMKGGLGDDVYFVDSLADVVVEDAGQGKDTVSSKVNFVIQESQEIEVLYLSSAIAIAGVGNSLNNAITATGSGQVSLFGKGGNDTLTGSVGKDDMIGDEGNDLLSGLGGDDRLTGWDGNDKLLGGDGNDTLDGSDGSDTLIGGKGDDYYIVRDNSEVITEMANQGTDLVLSVAAALTLAANVDDMILGGAGIINGTGNALRNFIRGSLGNNRIDGAGGNDLLFGGDGDDTLIGGAGNDELHGDAGANRLIGDTGSDSYTVDSDFDTVVEKAGGGIDQVFTRVDKMILADNVEYLFLTGSTGLSARGNALSNGLFGNLGNNVLMDDKGNDTLDGAAGADTLIGGAGNDSYVVDDANDVVLEAAGGGKDSVFSFASYQLKESEEIETLILSSGGLIIGHGNSGNNAISVVGGGFGTLYGEGGNDTITGAGGGDNILGGSGNDRLIGGDGADDLDGGTGKDVMIGGKGNDAYTMDDAGDTITELAKQGDDWVNSTLANYTLGANLENLDIDPGGLNGTGNGLNNTLLGNDVGNVLNGAGGRDLLFGGDGSDTLKGGAGFDILEGNAGADVLYGEADAADVFRYQIGTAGELSTLGGDTINGFKSGQDTVEITDLIMDFGIDPSTAFLNGFVFLIDNGANTDLLFDKDGGIGANVPVVLAIIVNANIAQADVALQGFAST